MIGAKTTSVAAAATVTTAPAHREEGEDGDEIEDEEDSGNYPVKFIVATEFRRVRLCSSPTTPTTRAILC